MSTIPTQNPVPSEAAKDLKFNSGKIDEFVTSLEHEYKDRFGRCHMTIEGMRWVFEQLMERFKVDINQAIIAAGYIPMDSFQQGAEITKRNEILRDETTGEYYRWDGDLPKSVPAGSTPESAGGVGMGAWVSVGAAAFGDKISTLPTFNGVYDVFVIYGQSNAVGFAGADSGFNTSDLVDISDKALYWDGTKISALTHYMKHASGDVSTGSAWDQFANTYIENTGRGVVFIPCAKAGASIDELLKGGVYYSNAKTYFDSFTASQKNIILDNIYLLFHQGEQDQLSAMDRDIYQSKLIALKDDMLIDFNLNKFYLFEVGSPITRSERLWSSIQVAQRYVANTSMKCALASKICKSFNVNNGLLGSDTTHYSIRGYNVMGEDAAKTVSLDVKTTTNITEQNRDDYQYASLFSNIPYNLISAYITMENNDGSYSFVINTSNNTGSVHRVSCFTDIIYKTDIKTFVLKSSTKISSVMNIITKVNSVGEQYGVYLSASKYDDRSLKLDFFMDFDFFINMTTGQILGLDANVAPPWIAGNVAISLSNGVATMTHGETKYLPLVTPASNPQLANTEGHFVSRRVSDTQFLVKTVSADYNVVQVSMKRVRVNAGTLLIPGFGFYVTGVTSEM
ncbi:TPA: hypothetical protein SMM89_003075 [Proteus mirabilis]|nr:hypothetical protein [Proteus mirabilis]